MRTRRPGLRPEITALLLEENSSAFTVQLSSKLYSAVLRQIFCTRHFGLDLAPLIQVLVMYGAMDLQWVNYLHLLRLFIIYWTWIGNTLYIAFRQTSKTGMKTSQTTETIWNHVLKWVYTVNVGPGTMYTVKKTIIGCVKFVLVNFTQWTLWIKKSINCHL